MPLDYEMSAPSFHADALRVSRPSEFNSYDSSSQDLTEPGYHEAPYGHQQKRSFNPHAFPTIALKGNEVDEDATASEQTTHASITNNGPRRKSLLPNDIDSADISSVRPSVEQTNLLKPSYQQHRRLSLDPARFPKTEPSGSKTQLFATAAEDFDNDGAGADEDESTSSDSDEMDDTNHMNESIGTARVSRDAIAIAGGGRRRNSAARLPDESMQSSSLYADTPSRYPTDEGPELLAYEIGDELLQRQRRGSAAGPLRYREEETAMAYSEADENDWSVGLQRKEHSARFQDAAGQDWGDERMTRSDDEGEDPYENQ
ncbi:hypothetical protein HKX48_006740 [Thoreauomyces humboldtii]|nr:hypothetical protein HKX48_006740 [Thoreauomyces humboldtii]